MQEEKPNSMYISADVVEEILLRLPLKTLGRLKSVSKEWKSILESKRFVARHLSLQKSGKIFIAAYNCDCGLSPSLLPESRFEEDEEFVYLHCDATRPSMNCNGLVCIPEPGWVNVLNPSTGQLQRNPVPSLLNPRPYRKFVNKSWSTYFPGDCAMGFGRDNVTGTYKVVRIFVDPNYCDILDVNTCEWRKLKKPRRYKVDVYRKSAYVNGSIYWLRIWPDALNGSNYKILALDLHTEEFHEVSPPTLHKGITFEAQIVNLEDRLAIATPGRSNHGIYDWELEIWNMDAKEETWSKTHSIGIIQLGVSRSFTPLTLSKQGNVVFYDDKKRLFKYYSDIEEVHSLSHDICVISPYVENIVPLQTQQVEASTRTTCIRRTTEMTQSIATGSRVEEFLRKGINIGTWLCKKIIKLLATCLLVCLLCCCFCSGTLVFFATSLIFLYWLACNCGHIIKTLVMMKLFSIITGI